MSNSEAVPYKPPPVRESLSCPVDLGIDGARVHWRQDVYRGKVVDFSISIQVEREDTGQWCDIYRVDTRHGELHHHVYRVNGDERRETIEVIPGKDAWEFVDKAWDEWLGQCVDQAEARIERWRRDE